MFATGGIMAQAVAHFPLPWSAELPARLETCMSACVRVGDEAWVFRQFNAAAVIIVTTVETWWLHGQPASLGRPAASDQPETQREGSREKAMRQPSPRHTHQLSLV